MFPLADEVTGLEESEGTTTKTADETQSQPHAREFVIFVNNDVPHRADSHVW